MRLFLTTAVVAAAYYVGGKAGLLLAIPPGYATAVWPPSGLALVAVLLHGYRVWPGVLLGSMLLNVEITRVPGMAHGLTQGGRHVPETRRDRTEGERQHAARAGPVMGRLEEA